MADKDGLLGDSEKGGGGKSGPDWSRFGLGKQPDVGGQQELLDDEKQGYQSSANKNELYRQDYEEAANQQPWWKANFLVTQPVLFGTWDGVFTSCMINIFGVVIFLRTGWMVGNVGIGLSVLIIFLTTSVALISVLSAIGVCERCKIESGGVYFLLSHVLGARIGAAIGIVYCFGQAVACSLYTVGFGESIASLLQQKSDWVAKGIAVAVVILLLGINLAGVKWVIRLQLVLLTTLFIAVLDFLVGSFVKTDYENGVLGYHLFNWQNNTGLALDEKNHETFFSVFGVFFPTATGVFAGINMSGDLRNPKRNIPVGTLSAVGVSTFLYLCFALVLGATVTRTTLQTDYMIAAKISGTHVFFLLGLYVSSITSCMVSLYGASRILQSISADRVIPFFNWLSRGVAWLGPLLLIGLYVSSLSAALGGLTGAPRVLQAIALSTKLPLVEALGRTWGANKVPIFSLVAITVVTLIFILIGNVNFLGPVVTMPFMFTYAAVDYAYFALAMSFDEHKAREARFARSGGKGGPHGYKATDYEYHDVPTGSEKAGHLGPAGKRHPDDLDSLFPERTQPGGPGENVLFDVTNASPSPGPPAQPATATATAVPGSENDNLLGVYAPLIEDGSKPAAPTAPVNMEITRQPQSWYSVFSNRWVSLFGGLMCYVIMFSIQWIYTLSCIVVVLALYLYIGQANPGVFPGVADFSLWTWLRNGVRRCFRQGPPPSEEIFVPPKTPSMHTEAAQLTEENEDFAARGRYHQSQPLREPDLDD